MSPVLRLWLNYAVSVTVLLGGYFLVAYAIGWAPHLDSCVGPGTCYCERFDEDLLRASEASGTRWYGTQQPVNTFSNLYAIFTAAMIAGFINWDRVAGNPKNVMTSKWWMGDVWVFCVLFLGLGSMWFHGSISSSWSWIDGMSMYVFAGFLVFYTADRKMTQLKKSLTFRSWFFWLGYPATVGFFTVLGGIGVPSEPLMITLVAVYLLLEWWAGFIWEVKPRIWWLCGVGSFGLAMTFRLLSIKESSPMCWPDSWFQPHGLLWHTFSGVMAVCLYFYWRNGKDGIGEGMPHHYQ